ncbi:hypothetical protein C1141_17855, partial [Vibrio agarivorans]
INGVAQVTSNPFSSWDLDIFDVSNLIANNTTNVCLRNVGVSEPGQLGEDWANLHVLGLQIEVVPEVRMHAGYVDHNGGYLEADDIVDVHINIDSTGNRGNDVYLYNILPKGISYVPNSMEIVSGIGQGTLTDAQGDDNGYYNSLNHEVHVNIGNGATSSSGGSLNSLDTVQIEYQIQIDSDVVDLQLLENQLNLHYADSVSGHDYPTISKSLKLIVRDNPVIAEGYVGDGSSNAPFAHPEYANNVTVAGTYYFYQDGTVFSSYVDENGWILIASGESKATGDYTQVSDISLHNNTILSQEIASGLRVNEFRMNAGSDENTPFDRETQHPIYIKRLQAYQSMGAYFTDGEGRGFEWTGTGGNITATCDAGVESLHKKIWHSCGVSSNLHWMPGSKQNGFNSLHNLSSNNLWGRFSADLAVIDEINGDNDAVAVNSIELNAIDGVNGAIVANESRYTTALKSGVYADSSNPTAAEIQSIIDQVNLLAAVAEDISGNADGTAVTADELNAIDGISGADAANESLYTDALQNGTYADSANPTAAEIQAVIDAVNTSEANLAAVAEDIAGNADGTAVTADELNAIDGISGADAANESLYTDALQNGTYADSANPTAAEIQAVIDAVNTSEANLAAVAEDIAGNADGTAVTADELNAIDGISGADAANESLYTDALQNGTYADSANPTAAEIQAVIDAVNTSEANLAAVAEDIAGNADGTAVTADELNAIDGISGADAANESLYTDALQNGTYADSANPTAAEIQAVIDMVNTSEANLAAVAEDIAGNADGTAVTADELNAIDGISGADKANESVYTDALANGTYADSANPTAAEIQAVIDMVNTSEAN